MWSAALYDTYAPYIQSKLPDVDIEFVVGNNDLDFYKFINVVALQKMDFDVVFLPYFGQNGEQWLLTYPAFQVALNKDLTKEKEKHQNAMKVLDVMLSEEGQNTLARMAV